MTKPKRKLPPAPSEWIETRMMPLVCEKGPIPKALRLLPTNVVRLYATDLKWLSFRNTPKRRELPSIAYGAERALMESWQGRMERNPKEVAVGWATYVVLNYGGYRNPNRRRYAEAYALYLSALPPDHFDPAWRTTATVGLARGIFDEMAFDRMPILADALEEAGYSDAIGLENLRVDRGVWARSNWSLWNLLELDRKP